MSDTPTRPLCVLPYATPAAKPGASSGVAGFLRHFLHGCTLSFAGAILIALCVRNFGGSMYLGITAQDPFFVGWVFLLLSGLSMVAAAAGAGVKRCVLRSAVSSTRRTVLAGGMLSAAATFGSLWAFDVDLVDQPTAWTLAAAAPFLAGFLLVRRLSAAFATPDR